MSNKNTLINLAPTLVPSDLDKPPFTLFEQLPVHPPTKSRHATPASSLCTLELPLPGAYIIHFSYPEHRGKRVSMGRATLTVTGRSGERLLSRQITSVQPQKQPKHHAACFATDAFDLTPLELHQASVPAVLSFDYAKLDPPSEKAQTSPRLALYCHEALSESYRQRTEQNIRADRDRVSAELAAVSLQKNVAYATGWIRPFLLLVSMSSTSRAHLARRLTVTFPTSKNPSSSSSSSSSSTTTTTTTNTLSSSAYSSSSSSSSSHLASIHGDPSHVPASHVESALLLKALASKLQDIQTSRSKWVKSLAGALAATQQVESVAEDRYFADLTERAPPARKTVRVAAYSLAPEQQLLLQEAAPHAKEVLGGAGVDWYDCLDETSHALLFRMLPADSPGVSPELLLPGVEPRGCGRQRELCREPVQELLLLAEWRVLQVFGAWSTGHRQQKADRKQRPYLLQFEHVLHELARRPEAEGRLAAVLRCGAHPAVLKFFVQSLLESWLSRVTNLKTSVDVPRLFEAIGLPELLDEAPALLQRPREERTFFTLKHSGRMRALGELGAAATTQGLSEGSESGSGSSLAAVATLAKESLAKAMLTLLKKQESVMLDVVMDVLLQCLILRTQGIHIEAYVPGYAHHCEKERKKAKHDQENATKNHAKTTNERKGDDNDDDDDEEDVMNMIEQCTSAASIPMAAETTRVNATSWSLENVLAWLDRNEFSNYRDLFVQEQIDGLALINMTCQDFQSIGILFGHAKRLYALVPRY